jgi:hypothetical protein
MTNDRRASGASYLTEFPAGQDLERQLREIKRERWTGSLRIGFEQGRPAGERAWKERLKSKQWPYDASERYLVQR